MTLINRKKNILQEDRFVTKCVCLFDGSQKQCNIDIYKGKKTLYFFNLPMSMIDELHLFRCFSIVFPR